MFQSSDILNYEDAAVWRGPMLSGAIKKLINDTQWGDLDYLLIDMPPGTGDVYLTIFKELAVDKFILITLANFFQIFFKAKYSKKFITCFLFYIYPENLDY